MSDESPQPYPLRGEHEIAAWKATFQPEDHEYQRVRFYIRRLMTNPEAVLSVANFIGAGPPTNSWVVAGTNTQVSWVVIKSPPYEAHRRCVMLTDIRPAP